MKINIASVPCVVEGCIPSTLLHTRPHSPHSPHSSSTLKVAPDCPPRLMVARWDAGSNELGQASADNGPLKWHEVQGLGADLPAAAALALQRLRYTVAAVVPEPAAAAAAGAFAFESVNFFPGDRDGPLPAIVMPHGGPHTAMTVGWYMPYAFLASLGFVVICPNYRSEVASGASSEV